MELPKRKNLRLKDYDYSQSNAYFITICTYDRINLFSKVYKDSVGAHLCVRPQGEMILKWLYELENKYPYVKIDYNIIMPDHIHFILFILNGETGAHIGAPLHEMIKWFKTQTTNEYIRGVKNGIYKPFNKHIWQRDYFEHIIRNEQDLFETRRYIEENPLRWVLKNDM